MEVLGLRSLTMYGNPNFTALPPAKSEVIRSPQELRDQARRAYDRQAERAKARREYDAQQRTDAQNQAAQNLVDYFTANPGQIDTGSYMYGTDGTMPSRKANLSDPLAAPMYYYDATSAFGNNPGGTFVPTLDEAKAILQGEASNRYNYTSFQNGDTPVEAIKRALGGNVSDAAANYLVSQNIIDPAYTSDQMKDAGISGGINGPQPWSVWGGFGSEIRDVADQAGADWKAFLPSQRASAGPDWNSTIGAVNNDIAQQSQRDRNANLAYNNYTLGGGYGGGMIDDSYSAPFAGTMNAGQGWGSWGQQDTGVPMPWATQSWNTPGYGQPGAPISGAYGGLGGLGGASGNRGSSGPWGARNPWSPG
jgi:hypothetical protein